MFEPTGPNIFEWMCFGVGGAALFWLAILMGDGNHLGSFQLRKVRLVNLIAGFICPHCQGLICALGANKARITSLRRNDPAWEHSDKEDWTRHQQLADTAIWIHATCHHCGNLSVFDDIGQVAAGVDGEEPFHAYALETPDPAHGAESSTSFIARSERAAAG